MISSSFVLILTCLIGTGRSFPADTKFGVSTVGVLGNIGNPLRWAAKHYFTLCVSMLAVTGGITLWRSTALKEEPQPQPVVQESITKAEEKKPEPREPTYPWSNDEVQAIVQTLAGECYDEMEQDKRLVCEVILNRVSDERFEDTVIGVLTTPNALAGYWEQSRPVSENDLEIAEQALQDWYANNCQPLSDIRFFCSGEGRQNNFY